MTGIISGSLSPSCLSYNQENNIKFIVFIASFGLLDASVVKDF